MQILFAARAPKDAGHPEQNDDSYALDARAGRIAVSDGASESYDSRTWSQLLVERFVRDARVGPAWLRTAVADYASRYDRETLSWSRQAAFDRGSFATLLGIEFGEEAAIRVVAVGDTTAVLLDGDQFIASFPYDAAEQFRARPELFSTVPALNTFYAPRRYRRTHRCSWRTRDLTDPLLLCMTDGIAEWAFREAAIGRPVWGVLRALDDEADLAGIVARERQAHAMRTDDVTLVIARPG